MGFRKNSLSAVMKGVKKARRKFQSQFVETDMLCTGSEREKREREVR